MNSKTLVTFLLGGVLAGGLILLFSPRGEDKAAETKIEEPAPAVSPEAVEPSTQAEPDRTPRREAAPVAKSRPKSEPTVKTATATEPKPLEAQMPSHVPGPAVTPAPSEPPKVEVFRPSREARPKPEPKTVTVPAGTVLNVRLLERLTTQTNVTGDEFSATLDAPLVIDGFVIAEKGARVQGKVVEAVKSGRVKGLAQLTLALDQFKSADGQTVKVQTDSFVHEAEKSTKKDAMKVGIGAGIGAAIGAIAGGGKGAAIGAGAGGAAGTGAVLATRGEAAELPSETRLSFRLSAPVSVTEKLP
jgi:hypothetical protein